MPGEAVNISSPGRPLPSRADRGSADIASAVNVWCEGLADAGEWSQLPIRSCRASSQNPVTSLPSTAKHDQLSHQIGGSCCDTGPARTLRDADPRQLRQELLGQGGELCRASNDVGPDHGFGHNEAAMHPPFHDT